MKKRQKLNGELINIKFKVYKIFYKIFTLQVKTIHKINLILVISLQILAKTFASNIIIDL